MNRRLLVGALLTIMLVMNLSVSGQDVIAPGTTIHVVQRGENLFRIALSYGLTTDQLAQLNGIIDVSSIQVGQRLLVPLEPGVTSSAANNHVVQAGETLRSIAELYGVTVEALAVSNQLQDVNSLYVGQTLVLPAGSAVVLLAPAEAESVPTETAVYTVQPGDTLFRIANSFGLSVNTLAEANNIVDPTVIFSGQQLIIPGVEPLYKAVDLPAPMTTLDVTPPILTEGQTVRVRFTTNTPITANGTFLERNLTFFSEENGSVHTMLIGVPIFTEAGVYPLALTLYDTAGQQTAFNVNFQIVNGGYSNETIDLLVDRNGLLDPATENAEMSILEGVMGRITPMRYFNGSMGLPAAATMTSPFGTRRSYNGGAFDRYHAGTDFAGVPGTPILASAPGIVVLADSLNVRGQATIIDHGWGVYTGYWHQTDQYVQVGEQVTAGQVIGTIGSSGRVTGAHLHWELWVNGVAVNPMQWVYQSFP